MIAASLARSFHAYGLKVFSAVALTGASMLWCVPNAIAQTSGQVTVSATTTLSGPVNAGQTQLDVAFAVSAMSFIQVQVILPVNGATVSLLDPSNNVVIAPTDPGISFAPGSALPTPLPGGMYILPGVSNPANGSWKLRAFFPSAPEKTVALVTIFAQSPYQVGIALAKETYRVGEPAAIGFLVVNQGIPITGLAPTLTIRKNGATVATLNARDSGSSADFDGLSNDGIYSQGYTFTDTGTFEIAGDVSIPSPGGSITRSASAYVDVVPRNLTLGSVTGTVVRSATNCVQSLDVKVTGSVVLAGTYSTAATLIGTNGNRIVKATSSALPASGNLSATVSFLASEIRKQIGVGNTFTVDPVDVVSYLPGETRLETRRPAALTFSNLAINDFCADPIEIDLNATVTPILRQNFIGQLDFTLPIRVTTAGAYQTSFKITDVTGADVGQFAFNQAFAAGVTNLKATVLADKLQKSDGPFNIESVLVVGNGTSAQASRIPTAGAFSRWQFFPTITGDLNADGSVSAADRDLVLTFRNQTALIPGDRRDINRDGKIDLLDAREIVNRTCSAATCPHN